VEHREGPRSIRYAVLFLFLLNLSAGLLFINEGLFHVDSVSFAQAVEKTYATGQLQPAVMTRYGSVIINSIVYLPFFLLGQPADFSVRFTSVLFGALSVAMLFVFVKELFDDYFQAFLCALLFSFTPFYLSPNTYGKEHSMAVFFLILSFYLLTRGLRKGSLVLISTSSFILAFSLTIRESLLATTPLFFLLYAHPTISIHPPKITIPRERLDFRWMLAVFVPFLMTFSLIFFLYLKHEIYRTLFARDYTARYFVAYFAGLFSPAFSIAWRDLTVSISPLLFVFSALGAVRMFFKRDMFNALFFLAWFMLLFYFGNMSSYVARYLDVVVIAEYVFASYALSGLYAKDKPIAFALAAYFIMSMLFFIGPPLAFRHRYNGEKQFALYVKQKTEHNAFIIAMDDSAFIDYYAKRKVLNHPIEDTQKTDDLVKTISGYLKNGIPVYALESSFTHDPGRIYKNALFNNFNILVIGQKLCEDYHKADSQWRTFDQKLFKITLRTAAAENKP